MDAPERRWRSRLAQIAAAGGLIRGTLLERYRACGNPNCRCARGQKHRAVYLMLSEGGRLRQLFIPKAYEQQVRQWVAQAAWGWSLRRHCTHTRGKRGPGVWPARASAGPRRIVPWVFPCQSFAPHSFWIFRLQAYQDHPVGAMERVYLTVIMPPFNLWNIEASIETNNSRPIGEAVPEGEERVLRVVGQVLLLLPDRLHG